jgi:hypothetical protein
MKEVIILFTISPAYERLSESSIFKFKSKKLEMGGLYIPLFVRISAS